MLGILVASSGCDPAPSQIETDEPSFRTSKEPTLSIGTLDGAEPYNFSGITDVFRFSDGRIVVADCRSSELRFYDRDGEHLRTVGRAGDGPGEFRFLRRIFPIGRDDTIGVYDTALDRVTVLDREGKVIRTVPFHVYANARGPDVIGYLEGAGYIARQPAPRDSLGSYRTKISLLVFDTDGVLEDSIVGLPGPDLSSPSPVVRMAQPLGRDFVVDVRPDRLAFGSQNNDGVTVFGKGMSEAGSFQTVTRSEAITSGDQEAFEVALANKAYQPADGVGPVFSSDFAPEMPAFRHLVLGEDNRIWIQDPERPGRYPLVWRAYESGRPVMRVRLPPRFFPLRFSEDWVLGVAYDQMTVERVQLYEFVEGPVRTSTFSPREAQPPQVSACGTWASR